MKQNILTIYTLKQIIITILLMIFMAIVMLHTSPAYAHAKLVKSDPPRRAVLSTPPKHIQLWFNEEIEGSFAFISVFDANKTLVTDARPEVIPEDLKSVVLPLPDLIAGRYAIEFRILSVDGHIVESGFSFTIKETAQQK